MAFFAFEIGYKQRTALEERFANYKLEFMKDIAGHDRMLIVY